MRSLELPSSAVGSSAPPLNGVVLLAVCLMAAAFTQGCERPSCEELHDPGCWIPPVTDAGSDAGDGEVDAADAEGPADAGGGEGEDVQAAGDAPAEGGSPTGD